MDDNSNAENNKVLAVKIGTVYEDNNIIGYKIIYKYEDEFKALKEAFLTNDEFYILKEAVKGQKLIKTMQNTVLSHQESYYEKYTKSFELYKSEYEGVELEFKDGLPIFTDESELSEKIICDSVLAKIFNLKEGEYFIPALLIYQLATEHFLEEEKKIDNYLKFKMKNENYYYSIGSNKCGLRLFFSKGLMIEISINNEYALACNQSLIWFLLKYLKYNIYGIKCYTNDKKTMNNKPKVSVVINTVDEQPKILIECIQSYQHQIGVEVEILISTIKDDPSIKTAQLLGIPQENIIINPVKGIHAQYNYATQFISHDWFQYGSGNDVMFPDKLISEYNKCIETGAKVCYSDHNICDENMNIVRVGNFPDYNYDLHLDYFHEKFPNQGGGSYVSDCALIHRSILEKYMPIRTEWGNYANYDFYLRVAEGEGIGVYCHLARPTWNYREGNTSKHVQRQSNPEEQATYMALCRAMVNSHSSKNHNPLPDKPFMFVKKENNTIIVQPMSEIKTLTVALPSFNSKNISWVAMEGLCNQKGIDFQWELIICEEQSVNMTGRDEFLKYTTRLNSIGCIGIKYIPIKEWITLSEKWKLMGDNIDKNSAWFILESCDDYSPPNKLKLHYDKYLEGYDWVQQKQGYFYELNTGRIIKYDGNLIKVDEAKGVVADTNINMGFSSRFLSSLLVTKLKSGVDYWLYSSIKKQNGGDLKVYNDESDNWKSGIFLQEVGDISDARSKYFQNGGHCYTKVDITIEQILPDYICNKLKSFLQ